MTKFFIKRVYEKAEATDGYRVLVDRLWPRGVSKEKAKLDEWAKNTAPSTELRKWFNHEIKNWRGFVSKYKTELKKNGDTENVFKNWKKKKVVTFVYGGKDELHNEAVILRDILK